uniref:E3 ubiquitin-protein ligase n=1 Tax=Timema tahoe TaxID=61484 RepID=A0A7R9FEW7_9NEOP|nr:unnamed protein product [Timema tahoe]
MADGSSESSGLSNAESNSIMNIAEIASHFECPVCFDYVQAPIVQCKNGHLVCSNCRPKTKRCPTCRGPLGKIRNLSMENLSCFISFPCKFVVRGCKALLFQRKMAAHVKACEFQPYSCPCPGAPCKWQGYLEDVLPHLKTSHKNITTLKGDDIFFQPTDVDLFGEVDWAMLQSCFNHNFMIVLKKRELIKGNEQFFAFAQLVGPRQQAKKFKYRLQLDGPGRRLLWEMNTSSIHEDVSPAFMKSNCLVFDTSLAPLYGENWRALKSSANVVVFLVSSTRLSEVCDPLSELNTSAPQSCYKSTPTSSDLLLQVRSEFNWPLTLNELLVQVTAYCE